MAGGGRRVKLIVGVTGEIGAGKTSVARIMEAQGARAVSLDGLGHEALGEPEIKRRLKEELGEGVFDGDEVDRRKLGKLVFDDHGKLARLNAIVHPAMCARARGEIEKADGLVVIEGALVFEMGLDKLCDAVVFVGAPERLRRERIERERGWDETELARRESAQLPSDRKSQRSDRSITNDGSEEELERKVNSILEDLGWRRTRSKGAG